MTLPTAILIAGPTASGKSAFALALAERLGGSIINADSMQVYRELRVLTARPSAADMERAPHRLYGHVPGSEAYSAGRYAREAADAIAAVRGEGRVPIIAGGTGLYFSALLTGLSPIPQVPAGIRDFWREEARRLGAAGLHAELARRDPVMAVKLSPTDPQRVTRALEVLDGTGRSLADWQAQPGMPVLEEAACAKFVIEPDRDTLHARCNARFDAMMSAGALDEVRGLAALNLAAELPVMRALGVKPLMAALAGEMALDAAVEQAKADTRGYVKRQSTWLRRNMISWMRPQTQEKTSSLDEIVSFIET